MRKRVLSMAAPALVLALTLCACGRPQGPQQAMTTTAADPTAQQAAASQKPAVTSDVTLDVVLATEPTTTATAAATTTASTATSTTRTLTATTATTSTTTATTQLFGGAEIVLATPSRGIDESLGKNPHAVYAIDMGGRRFLFQPQAFDAAVGFAVDVWLDNRGGSYTKLDTFANSAQSAGTYSIVLVTPGSKVTKDERQGLTLVSDVYRFELSTGNSGRYSVCRLDTHTPYALTAYYALDAGSGGFSRVTF